MARFLGSRMYVCRAFNPHSQVIQIPRAPVMSPAIALVLGCRVETGLGVGAAPESCAKLAGCRNAERRMRSARTVGNDGFERAGHAKMSMRLSDARGYHA